MKIQHSKPHISKEDIDAVAEQIISGMHATGSKTKEFEEKMSELIGVRYKKATTSGTTALHLALLALDVKRGDEVILPSYVCTAVLNAVNYTHATPILADIQDDFVNRGCNISIESIKPLITDKTKAIIVPHMFGIPADIEPVLELGIPVIEDCAQALGAKYKGEKVGSIGDIAIFSFYATKVISTGQGGIIVTNSKEISNKINSLTTYDKKENYTLGYNYNLSDIQSALGLSQLERLPEFINRRREIVNRYDKAFENKFNISKAKDGFAFRYIIYANNKNERDKMIKDLEKQNIICNRPIYKPLHQYLRLDKENFKNTELAHDTAISIPIYPALTDEEVERVIGEVSAAYHKHPSDVSNGH